MITVLALMACLAVGFALGYATFPRPPKTPPTPRCHEVLDGLAMERCELGLGHDGPHFVFQGQTLWFESGTDMVRGRR